MAAKFDATASVEKGFRGGDGIPVHVEIPTDNPWVPLRILGAAKVPQAQVSADVFLLTDHEPSLLYGNGFDIVRSQQASTDAARRPSLRQALVVGARRRVAHLRPRRRACRRSAHRPRDRRARRGAGAARHRRAEPEWTRARRRTAARTGTVNRLDDRRHRRPASSCWSVWAPPSASSTVDGSRVDRTHAVNRSSPLITCPQRTDWNPSNVCCAPGSSANATGARGNRPERVHEVTSVLDEQQRVLRAVHHEERRRVGPHLVQR